MRIEIEPGKYVVAVSGGIDSIVLLDLLTKLSNIELIVAHYDHGIRPDSSKDRMLVESTARKYGLPFVYMEGRLGSNTSEAAARQARYDFFRKIRQEYAAKALITAHHQDDLLETAILNIIRGTGRKGLTSLATRKYTLRPMLHLSKTQILTYAHTRGLVWREDSTNLDEHYLRNYIRRQIVPRFDDQARHTLLGAIEQGRVINRALDRKLAQLLNMQSSPTLLNRQRFIGLPHVVAKEFFAYWLRANDIRSFDARTIERLVVAAKVGRPGTFIDIVNGASLKLTKRHLALIMPER